MSEIYTKRISCDDFEIKDEGGLMVVEGYASTFGNKDLVGDVIEQGAFGRPQAKKVKFLYQHDVKMPIGVVESIKEDDKGLFMKAKFADTQLGRDVYTLADMGAIGDFSVGFRMDAKGFSYDEKRGVRKITKAKLMEVSMVTFPANEKANVTAVKDFNPMDKRDFEDMLKMMGLSQNEALITTAKAYPALVEHWESGNKLDNRSESDLNKLKSSVDELLTQLKGN